MSGSSPPIRQPWPIPGRLCGANSWPFVLFIVAHPGSISRLVLADRPGWAWRFQHMSKSTAQWTSADKVAFRGKCVDRKKHANCTSLTMRPSDNACDLQRL